MSKIKIAILDLTGCEGCEFQLLNLDEKLWQFFQDFDIVNWRLLGERKDRDFDIAFVEGAVTTKEHIKMLKEVRETSKIVVALGACAISGNVFAQLNPEMRKKLAKKIYDKNYKLKGEFLEPVKNFIKVDEEIPGCPPDIKIFNEVLGKLKKSEPSKEKEVFLPDYTAKIEGHGTLKVDLKKKKVKFQVEESERLVEGLLLDKDFKTAPFITSRICGICPIAHNICSLSAIENALKIKIPEETLLLRRILLSAQVIKSHLLHLFFLVLPDYTDTKGAVEFSKKYPAEFHLVLNIKRIADEILETIGGSKSFPTNTTIGGFINLPKKEKLLSIQTSISEVVDEAQDLIKIFSSLDIPKIQVNTLFLTTQPTSLAENNYPLYPGNLQEEIKEIVKNNSPAKLGVLENGKVVKVGALSRLKGFSKYLCPKAKNSLLKYPFDFQNPFNNNIAQSIEILHFLEEVSIIIDKIKNMEIERAQGIKKLTIPSGLNSGIAFVEAPRGVLIHQIEINSQGKITNYNIIPPTQINLASLEKEAQELIKLNYRSKEETKKNIEKLIRAFDPCITCAVH